MQDPGEWVTAPIASDDKIAAYLLNVDHPTGGPKARYFLERGFSLERPEPFIEALFQHCVKANLVKDHQNEFTRKLVYEAPLVTPDGRNPMVRSVWQIVHGEIWQSLVTAYRI